MKPREVDDSPCRIDNDTDLDGEPAGFPPLSQTTGPRHVVWAGTRPQAHNGAAAGCPLCADGEQ